MHRGIKGWLSFKPLHILIKEVHTRDFKAFSSEHSFSNSCINGLGFLCLSSISSLACEDFSSFLILFVAVN